MLKSRIFFIFMLVLGGWALLQTVDDMPNFVQTILQISGGASTSDDIWYFLYDFVYGIAGLALLGLGFRGIGRNSSFNKDALWVRAASVSTIVVVFALYAYSQFLVRLLTI